VAMQQRCRPLYGEEYRVKNSILSVGPNMFLPTICYSQYGVTEVFTINLLLSVGPNTFLPTICYSQYGVTEVFTINLLLSAGPNRCVHY
jgi:hypothetical protein